jgi:hypothetical protein
MGGVDDRAREEIGGAKWCYGRSAQLVVFVWVMSCIVTDLGAMVFQRS